MNYLGIYFIVIPFVYVAYLLSGDYKKEKQFKIKELKRKLNRLEKTSEKDYEVEVKAEVDLKKSRLAKEKEKIRVENVQAIRSLKLLPFRIFVQISLWQPVCIRQVNW